jgi:hypothetical protein
MQQQSFRCIGLILEYAASKSPQLQRRHPPKHGLWKVVAQGNGHFWRVLASFFQVCVDPAAVLHEWPEVQSNKLQRGQAGKQPVQASVVDWRADISDVQACEAEWQEFHIVLLRESAISETQQR